jgi:hypothetical protein
MQICGNGPVHSADFVHLAASCAQAPTLTSALDAMIAANSIELRMVMISLPLMLSEKVMLSEKGRWIAVNRQGCDASSGAFMLTAPQPAGSPAEKLPIEFMVRNQRL